MGWGGRCEGGSGWGTHLNPWLIHVSVWQKPLKYCKVIIFQLIKVNEKTIKSNLLFSQKKRKKKRCVLFETMEALSFFFFFFYCFTFFLLIFHFLTKISNYSHWQECMSISMHACVCMLCCFSHS